MNKTFTGSIMVVALMSLAACADKPTAKTTRATTEAGTRTGMVKNIVVNETIAPASLTVHAGDEVRWINQRREPIEVTVNSPIENTVSCNKGFTKALGMGVDNTTKLDSQETAGLCFTRIGTINYSVKPSSDERPGLSPTQGSITVQ